MLKSSFRIRKQRNDLFWPNDEICTSIYSNCTFRDYIMKDFSKPRLFFYLKVNLFRTCVNYIIWDTEAYDSHPLRTLHHTSWREKRSSNEQGEFIYIFANQNFIQRLPNYCDIVLTAISWLSQLDVERSHSKFRFLYFSKLRDGF